MKFLIIVSFLVEGAGIGVLSLALIEGIQHNPAQFLAPLGGFLIVAGGFLMNKCLKMIKCRRR